MSALHDNVSSDSLSGTHSSSEDDRASSTMAESDENDGITSAEILMKRMMVPNEEDDESESESDR